jgi:DNA repair photolyase
MRRLTEAGVHVGVLACPVMPLINDSRAALGAVAKAAMEAGARTITGNVLFLKPCAQKAFFPMLESEFPHLVRRYRERYEKAHFLKGNYPDRIRQRMTEIRAAYGLDQRAHQPPATWGSDEQLNLFAD